MTCYTLYGGMQLGQSKLTLRITALNNVLCTVDKCVPYSGQVCTIQCTVHSLLCTVEKGALYSEHCTVCTVQCTLHSVLCAVKNVHCTMYFAQCAVCSGKLCIVQCILHSVLCTMEECALYRVYCTVCWVQVSVLPAAWEENGWTIRPIVGLSLYCAGWCNAL